MRSVAFVHKVGYHEFQHQFSVGDRGTNLIGTEKILVVQVFCEFLIIARQLSDWKFKEALTPKYSPLRELVSRSISHSVISLGNLQSLCGTPEFQI